MDEPVRYFETEYFRKCVSLERRFAHKAQAILGRQFFTTNRFSDWYEGTDFAIFSADSVRCAFRLRRYDYLRLYPDDITIRWMRASGAMTERHKICAGLVNYMLYGFVDEAEEKLMAYSIVKIPHPFEAKPFSRKINKPPDGSGIGFFKLDQFEIVKRWRR